MTIAINPDTGELSVFQDGTWSAPQRAKNPETGQELFLYGGQWQPVPYRARMPDSMKEREKVTGKIGATDVMLQGIPFADEVGAAGSATGYALGELVRGNVPSLSDIGKRYDQTLEWQREGVKDFMNNAPVAGTGLQVVGSMAMTPAKALSVPGNAGRGFNLLEGAKQGAIAGGITGFSSGEGFTDRLASGAIGTTLGGTIGAAVPATVEVVRRALRPVATMMGLRNAENTAMDHILRAMQQDGLSEQEAIARLQDWSREAKPAMLFDLAGENTRRLARTVGTVPGEGAERAQTAIADRQRGQIPRVEGAIADLISPNGDALAVREGLMAQRRAAAAPLYEAAYEKNPFIWNNRIQQFIDDPIVKQGINKGLEVQRLEALAEGKAFDPKAYGVVDFDQEGGFITGGKPNLRLLDAAKRGLDEILEQYRDKTTGKLVLDQRGNAINQVRKSFVSAIDDAARAAGADDYIRARQAWSGSTASMDAVRLGMEIFDNDARVTVRAIRDLSPADKEFFRAGVADAIRTNFLQKSKLPTDRNLGADSVENLIKNQKNRSALRAAFDDDATYNEFIKSLERERTMFENSRFVSPNTGSQTQPRGQDVMNLENDPVLGVLANVAQGNYGAAARGAAQNVGRYSQGVNSDIAAELAKTLFESDPRRLIPALQAMARRDAENQARMMINAARSRAGARAAGAGATAATE